jgi:hypothetical protein
MAMPKATNRKTFARKDVLLDHRISPRFPGFYPLLPQGADLI